MITRNSRKTMSQEIIHRMDGHNKTNATFKGESVDTDADPSKGESVGANVKEFKCNGV